MLMTLISIVSCASQAKKENENLKMSQVQKQFKKGVTKKSDVIETLGQPEMINTDESGDEQWVYSKHKNSGSSSSNGIGILGDTIGTFMGSDAGYLIGASMDSDEYESSNTMLTLYVNFNKKGVLQSYNYSKSNI